MVVVFLTASGSQVPMNVALILRCARLLVAALIADTQVMCGDVLGAGRCVDAFREEEEVDERSRAEDAETQEFADVRRRAESITRKHELRVNTQCVKGR
ncbi:hypothetical protein [Kitasatospora viridis]|uniref:hypothetical protein n=1 Tax=Kitasatospora viridis TaxID=281105 RepID=UPI00119E1C7F|nr:hypothetical protein [Kitasatospora viridis]